MFRKGSNRQAVFAFLDALEVGEEKEFDAKDELRPGYIINDHLARSAIGGMFRILEKRFLTKVKENKDGLPRLFITRKK